MEIINKIKDGIHLDNNVYDQPDMTMRDNLNGVITDLGNGNFKWSNIKGNELSFTIGTTDRYFSHCRIRDRLFILTLSTNNNTFRLKEVTFSGNTGTITTLYTEANSIFGLSYSYPIRTIIGFYENEDTQRIYWSDYHMPPRCINVQSLPSNSKFVSFFPVIDGVYGRLSKSSIIPGGSVKAGTVFFAWRYYTDDGYYTDWSPITNPVQVTGLAPGSSYNDYQNYQGMAPDENTEKKVSIEISDIDSDYNNIQVCVFYSNDYNISIPGVIFYDGDITADTMTFIYSGSENLGTVTIDDLIQVSIKVDQFKDSCLIKKQNVIAALKEREELDLPAYISANISVVKKGLPIDTTGYPQKMSSATQDKALFGVPTAAVDRINTILRRGQWYKAITQTIFHDGVTVRTISAGNFFYIDLAVTSVTYNSGDFKAVILKKKYLLASGTTGGDVNTDYAFDYEFLENEHLDWKSQKVSKTYRSYPQGETIRLGILFFDLTGRPFFVRHIRNTNTTYGPGDTVIPKRSDTNPMLYNYTANGTGGTLYYESTCAILQYLKVSGIDITDIKDLISGFMIVRCPIVHQYLGMGLLLPTHLETNKVFSMTGLFPIDNNTANYYGCYDFFCPEDLFSFKGFNIQPTDELENVIYLTPYYKTEKYTLGHGGSNNWYGVGRQESSSYTFYQKLYIEGSGETSDSNGILSASHEIKSVTKYVFGEDDVLINPLDATKLYSDYCHGYYDGYNHHAGFNANHSVVILDIEDDKDNIKGPNTNTTQTNPKALLCSLKRPNADPYCGYTLSSVANSVYMSTGHFQKINASVLSDIESNGTYIFNDIEIFGGDTFVQLFDYKRIWANFDDNVDDLDHSLIFPIESRMNLSMREGEHIAKTRSWDSSYNNGGLKFHTGKMKLEEFNYNDGYSTDIINDFYLPLPFNYKNISENPSRLRFSPEKNYGEKRDSFRVFLPNDYIDLDPNKGEITNIKVRNDKVIYWQPDEIGFIPVKERALTQTNTGQTVQLGTGGIFERYDELKSNLGNSHQFGLIESPIGFHWYDSRRKLYLTLTDNLQITPESVLKGLDSFFQNNIPDNFEQYDNPFNTYGIIGGYDTVSKMIFSTFIISGSTKTIGINTSLNKFVGFYQIYPGAYLEYKNHLFHIKSNFLTVYIHGTGTYMNFFGTQYHAYLTFVIKEDSNTPKIFDTFEIIASNNFFNKATYANSSQSKEEDVCSYTTGSCVTTNRNYKYIKRRWFGNFPKASRERLNDGYLLVTFEIEYPYLVELFEMKSIVRKNY